MKTVNKHEHKLSICTDRRFLKIHEFNSFISTNIIVNKREQKQSICTDRRFLKIHEFNSFILPKTTVTLRTLYLFVFVHFICSCSYTRPWLVKCTTFFWLRTLNKLANILPRHYYHPLVSADPVLGGVYHVSAVQELLEAPEFSTFRLLPPQYTPALYTTAPHS